MDEPKDAGTGTGAAGAGACATEADGNAEAASTDASEEAFAQLQRLYDQLPAMEERGVLLARAKAAAAAVRLEDELVTARILLDEAGKREAEARAALEQAERGRRRRACRRVPPGPAACRLAAGVPRRPRAQSRGGPGPRARGRALRRCSGGACRRLGSGRAGVCRVGGRSLSVRLRRGPCPVRGAGGVLSRGLRLRRARPYLTKR